VALQGDIVAALARGVSVLSGLPVSTDGVVDQTTNQPSNH
jgi:hypothetical protein